MCSKCKRNYNRKKIIIIKIENKIKEKTNDGNIESDKKKYK